MAKKKNKVEEQPTLDFPGFDWNDPPGARLPLSTLREKHPVDVLTRSEASSDNEDAAYPGKVLGYHATPAEPEVVLKHGVVASNPITDSGHTGAELGVDARIHRGVFFHGVPHTEYGPNIFRLAIPESTKIYDEYDYAKNGTRPRGGEGLNVTSSVPAKQVSLYGHAGGGNTYDTEVIHKTDALPGEDTCHACREEAYWLEDRARKNMGPQFNG